MVSYSDDLDFQNLMDDLHREGKNGFIRVTSGSEEGYILFKEGKQVAASYEEYAKLDALEKILSAMDNSKTLIEVFDVGLSQIDYLLDLNKPYKFDEVANVYDVIDELKKTSEEKPESESTPKADLEPKTEPAPEPTPKADLEPKTEPAPEPTPKADLEPKTEPAPEADLEPKTEPAPEADLEPKTEPAPEADLEPKTEPAPEADLEAEPQEPKVSEPVVVAEEKPSVSEVPSKELESFKASTASEEPASREKKIKTPKPSETEESPESSEPAETEESEEELTLDRSELLKKYGIEDVEEEQIESLLQTYKGGIIEDEDVEKVEFVLMNTIKKSVLGVPKIKGTEVMVFLDNFKDLTGSINIIVEYESQGFFNRLIGQSKISNNLTQQIINIAEIQIKKCFRQYPEVVEKFDINVEFS